MKKIGGFLLLYYRYIILVALIIASSLVVIDPIQNFKNVIMLQAPYVIIYAFGMTIAMLTGGLDLSIGSNAALSSCVGCMFIIQGNVVLGLAVGVGCGALIGLINGLLITKTKVPPFIATYGMDWVARGAAYIFMGGGVYFGFTKSFVNIAAGDLFGISNLLIIALVIFVIMFFLFQKTTFGRNVYMTGSNPTVAKLTGVRTEQIIILVYVISGILAAIVGLLYAARLDTAEPYLGKEFGATAIASALIGGTALSGGKGGVGNTVVGVCIMVFLTNMLNVLKVSVLWQDVVFGVVIAVTAILEKFRNNYVLKRLS